MSNGDPDDDLSEYKVSVPFYKIAMSGKVAAEAGNPDGKLPDSVENIDDFDEIRYHTSDMHLNSALFFADEAERIEEFLIGEDEEDDEELEIRIDARVPLGNRHDIYVVNSVISTVSFMEALVNEFYDRHESIANKEPNRLENEMEKDENVSNHSFYTRIADYKRIENRDFEYKPLLDKYQYLLSFADKELFNTGEDPYQSVALINGFRNNLVHAQAEWINLNRGEDFSIGKSLEGKFEPNPLASDIPLPRQYLSFDCTKWCVESTFEFIEEFHERLGVKLPDHVQARKDNIWDVDSILEVEEVKESEQ